MSASDTNTTKATRLGSGTDLPMISASRIDDGNPEQGAALERAVHLVVTGQANLRAERAPLHPCDIGRETTALTEPRRPGARDPPNRRDVTKFARSCSSSNGGGSTATCWRSSWPDSSSSSASGSSTATPTSTRSRSARRRPTSAPAPDVTSEAARPPRRQPGRGERHLRRRPRDGAAQPGAERQRGCRRAHAAPPRRRPRGARRPGLGPGLGERRSHDRSAAGRHRRGARARAHDEPALGPRTR